MAASGLPSIRDIYSKDSDPASVTGSVNALWHGMYRAKVVEVDIEENDYGAVRVFIPDLFVDEFMEKDDFDENQNGLVAYPANNPMGGYNTEDSDSASHYQASIAVPRKNSWVWVFFEGGDPSKPFYFAAFMYKNSKLPPENRGVSEPHKVITVCKTGSGRAIVICDSDDQQRVEITGKKRSMSGGPAGEGSVYDIDGNMTSILLDERDGGEKLLIKSHQGDYIKFDVTNRELQFEFESDIIFKTKGKFQIDAEQGIVLNTSAGGITEKSSTGSVIKSDGPVMISSEAGDVHIKGASNVFIDGGATVMIQNKVSQSGADPELKVPDGSR